MLHQKELILNEKDTENFLMSLEVMEKIIKMIDLQSANAQYLGNLNSPTFGRLKEEMYYGKEDTYASLNHLKKEMRKV